MCTSATVDHCQVRTIGGFVARGMQSHLDMGASVDGTYVYGESNMNLITLYGLCELLLM